MTLTRRSLLAGSLAAKPARKTNVVMIMTDDHGAWTLGTYGCPEMRTPNIDGLARTSIPSFRGYVRGLRTETLKYIERTKEFPSELYDLEADPGEKRNVIAEPGYQKMVAELRRELSGLFEAGGAPPIEQWRSTTRQKLNVYTRRAQ